MNRLIALAIFAAVLPLQACAQLPPPTGHVCTVCGPVGGPPPGPPPPGIAPDAFLAAVASAHPGDVLALAPGVFPHLLIRNAVFSPPLTITSANGGHPAEINGVDFLSSTGLRLVNLDIHETDPVSSQSPVLNVVGSNDVAVSDSIVRGTYDLVKGLLLGKGVVVTGGSDFAITNSEIRDLFKGISAASVGGLLKVQGNDLHNIRTSPIDGGGLLTGSLIDANHIHDIVPVASQGDHSDGIHFFTKSGSPITDMTISNNRMEMGGTSASGTLGINLEGTASPGGFVNITVTGNTLRWNNNQGITTNWVQGRITNNILRAAPGLDRIPAHAPGIILRNSSVIITGNTVKISPSMMPYANDNTILTLAQITADGAP